MAQRGCCAHPAPTALLGSSCSPAHLFASDKGHGDVITDCGGGHIGPWWVKLRVAKLLPVLGSQKGGEKLRTKKGRTPQCTPDRQPCQGLKSYTVITVTIPSSYSGMAAHNGHLSQTLQEATGRFRVGRHTTVTLAVSGQAHGPAPPGRMPRSRADHRNLELAKPETHPLL